ncbi:alpha-amylase family glycosyl hydrolase [Teichococcus vastitatis]|uniref:Alpha-amylase family glycosyl hydrolase n=1 Tax=Teichococcus vastitatis TaxID=2307076 RepID=A0ABS9W7X6_9PROT|nr:alpha-amylase family glycosyl hydrolase [Pseudoroseomonas vastitatis]MCI0754875.1 alpha-amylase family glycosyl hydrolase [Pseudoroseomonas vastitatis]
MNSFSAGFPDQNVQILDGGKLLSRGASEEWWRGAVIYQVYPRSFADGNGDGVGDLPGLLGKLDYIAGLGVDAIWISPFQRSPQEDYGYDVSDYCDVDPLFGTLADFDRVLARAHALGLRVLMDQVWSHSSNRHPWFLESRASRGNAKSNWYVWADPAPDGTAPSNWLSVFGGPAWSWEPRRRQYYLHHFLASQPAFNLHNPEVVEALMEIGRFWLDRGVDGFRLDAVDWMCHDPSLRGNPSAHHPGDPIPAKPFGMQLHQNDLLHPRTLDVLRSIRSLQDEYPGVTTLAEVSSQDGAFDRLRRYTGEGMLDMAYTLRFMRGPLCHETVASTLRWMSEHAVGWPCWAFSNHDVERVASRWNPQRGQPGYSDSEAPASPTFLRMLMAMLLCLRGSICVYQGEELGLPEASLRQEELRDPFGISFWPDYKGRDGSRTPMPWSANASAAGFSEGQPWLPVPLAHRVMAVDVQEQDAESPLASWRDFLQFRREQPALVRGSLQALELPAPLVGFTRTQGEQTMICVFNLSETAERAVLPGTRGARQAWGSNARLGRAAKGGRQCILEAHGAIVLEAARGTT